MALKTYQEKLEQFKLNREKQISKKKTQPIVSHKEKKEVDKTTQFKKQARKIFGYEYDYSNVVFNNNRDCVSIICRIHGPFLISPYAHLNGKGCPICNPRKRKKPTDEEFIKECKLIHGNKYDYSKVQDAYINEKICIICPEHGEFWISPKEHLEGETCPKCHKDRIRTREDFIQKAKEIHGDEYDYSKVNYVDSKTKVCIICPEHGEFWQIPSSHLAGSKCPMCNSLYSAKHKLTTEEFIERSKKIHGNKYDYSKVDYKRSHAKVCIVCPEHGEFWQRAHQHLKGSGCPVCSQSEHELNVRQMLLDNNIEFIPQKTFDWLKYKSNMYLDFYLPQYNLAIECQGGFHYKMIEKYGGIKKLNTIKKRDRTKNNLCMEHNINILYYGDKEYGDNIITDLNYLLNFIKQYE